MGGLPMKEIAARINAHLKEHEADKDWNVHVWTDRCGDEHRTSRLYSANAYYSSGARLSITYVSYQGQSHLTKAEALTYLAWLDAGNHGTHWQGQREQDGGEQ